MPFDPFSDRSGPSAVVEHVLKEVRGQTAEWMNEYRKAMEQWAASNGYSPLLAKEALAFIDELKKRGVQSFEGLGFKVTLAAKEPDAA